MPRILPFVLTALLLPAVALAQVPPQPPRDATSPTDSGETPDNPPAEESSEEGSQQGVKGERSRRRM